MKKVIICIQYDQVVELMISYRLGQHNFSWTIVVEQFPQWDIKVHQEIKKLRCNMYSQPYVLLLMSESSQNKCLNMSKMKQNHTFRQLTTITKVSFLF